MPEPVRCPECQRLGLHSAARVDSQINTVMAVTMFHDTEGRFHAHDPNSRTTHYSCLHGHAWSQTRYDRCWCGWQAQRPPWPRQDEEIPLNLRPGDAP